MVCSPVYIWMSTLLFFHAATTTQWPRAFSLSKLCTITVRHTTVGRTPLHQWSARRRDLYLTTHNTHNTHPCPPPPPMGFEPAIPANERLQAHALDRAATGIGDMYVYIHIHRLSNKNYSLWTASPKHLTPNGHFSGRTAQLTSRCCIFLFIQKIYVLNILNMLHTLCFFPLFKMPFIS